MLLYQAENVRDCLLETFEDDPFELFQSDNGGEFKNELVHEAIAEMDGKAVHSASRHPQTNGQVERVNKTLKKLIWSAIFREDPDAGS